MSGLRRAVALLSAVALASVAGCASDSHTGTTMKTSTTTNTKVTTARSSRPAGPAATIAGPMTGGKGINVASAEPVDLSGTGYTQAEYTASGTAGSYVLQGEVPADGRMQVKPGPTAPYATRIIVRRPRDATKFNGTVVVEWLNVSGGLDAAPDYTYLEAELLRQGYAWVGVSAQKIGIEGGPVAVQAPGAEEAGAGKGLRTLDPERYGKLHHPGDSYAYDMYTQVARALRDPGKVSPLRGLDINTVLAIGESQSAFALTTYYDAVQPVTHEFDGFFVHSRGGASMPLTAPGGYVAIADALGGTPVHLRTDLQAPALMIETETDVVSILGYYPARQPDSETVHTWEVAGTAHADAFQVGDRQASMGCLTPINDGQQVFVLRAGLRALRTWVRDGTPPATAKPLAVDESSGQPTSVRDDLGIATGGVRTPSVDVPTQVLSGESPEGSSVLCLLLGSTTPIPEAELAARYPTKADYLHRYEAATDAAIHAGFLLADDRPALLHDANPDLVGG